MEKQAAVLEMGFLIEFVWSLYITLRYIFEKMHLIALSEVVKLLTVFQIIKWGSM